MEAESQNQSVQAGSQSGEGQTQETIEVQGTPEELASRLKATSEEAKFYRQKNSSVTSELAALKESNAERDRVELETNGKKDEAISAYRDENTKLKKQISDVNATYAYNARAAAVRRYADKAGCVDSDALIGLYSLDEIPVDEHFNVDDIAVKSFVDQVKDKKRYMFSTSTPKYHSGAAVESPDLKAPKKKENLSDLTLQLAKITAQ